MLFLERNSVKTKNIAKIRNVRDIDYGYWGIQFHLFLF